jgi:ferredoxin
MGNIKVTVNHNRCVGSQLCMHFLPDVFDLDGNGQAIICELGDTDVITLVQTAEQCPQCAIKVEDESTGEVLFPPAELGM